MALLGLLGALASPVAAQTPPSTDATLSGLELSEGRLDPPFASGITSYAAAVGYTGTQITVSPTRNDANATLEFLDGSDNPLTDADGSTDGLRPDRSACAARSPRASASSSTRAVRSRNS